MNTLKTIQVLAKIGRILSRIVFVCSIVGAIICAVGVVSLAVTGSESFKVGGVTIHSMVENAVGLDTPALIAAMAAGMVLCIGEIVLSRFAVDYFSNELADGTPFTLRGAKELMRLGILTIAIPLGTAVVCAIGIAVADNFYPSIEKLIPGDDSSVGLGIMMIVLSLVCRYGAELTEGKPTEAGLEEARP